MPRSSIVIHHVTARARKGHSERLGASLSGLVGRASAAQGCLHFALEQSTTDADLWVISGSWSGQQAMNAWLCSPDLSVFSELVQQCVVSSFDFETFVSVGAGEAEAV